MVRQAAMLVRASLAEHRVSGGSREVLRANLAAVLDSFGDQILQADEV